MGWTRPWSSDLAPVTSYVVQLLQGTTVQETDTVNVGSTIDREKTFDNLISETKYNARVAAMNSVGQGSWSNLVAFTTPRPDRTCFSILTCVFTLMESHVTDDLLTVCLILGHPQLYY